MFRDRTISVIIPCLNEERGLGIIFASMPVFVDSILVVDNGSMDDSRRIAERCGAKVLLEEQKGYGAALLKGLQYAATDINVLMDGDGSYPATALEEILGFLIDNKLDFVSGCRFPLVNASAMPALNRLGNFLISWLIREKLKIRLIDSQSGLMIFKKEIIDRIHINNSGMGFSQELKIKVWLDAQKGIVRCSEMHIPYGVRAGEVKFRKVRDAVKNLFDVLRLAKELRTRCG